MTTEERAGLRCADRDQPAMLRLVTRAQYSPVHQAPRCRHLAEDCVSVMFAGIIKAPGQELWPLPRSTPSAFLHEEGMPLALAQVLFDEGQYCLLLVRQMLEQQARQLFGARGQRPAAPSRGIDGGQRGRDECMLMNHCIDGGQVCCIGKLMPQDRP